MRRLFIVLCLLLLAASPDRLQKVLDRAVERGVPGLQACLTSPDFQWVGVAGYADTKARVRVTPTTRFRIASCSKTMVAVTALLLVGDGKLALDDSIGKYLAPDVARHFPKGITVRMLLNHTSGLEDYYGAEFDEVARRDPRREWTNAQALRYGYDLDPTGKPGARHYYSNTNYVMLGVIIEKVTGEPLGVTMGKRLFTPLGMKHTYCGLYSQAPRETAHGYDEGGDNSFYNPGDGLGDGGVLSTAPDMAIFLRALMEKRILEPAQQKQLMTWVDDDPDSSSKYGLGLSRYDTDQGLCYGHDGSMYGYRAGMWYYEKSRTVVVTLANTDTKDPVFDPLVESLEEVSRR